MKRYTATLLAGLLLAILFGVGQGICDTPGISPRVDETPFQAELQKWDSLCANAIGAFSSVPPDQADKLFFSDDSPLNQLQASKACGNLETAVGAALARWVQDRATSGDRDVFTVLEQHGLRPGVAEGTPFLAVDESFFLQKAKGSFSPDLLEYLKVREKQPQSFFSDGGCRYSVGEMGGWAVQWERFIAEHPRNAHRAKAEEQYVFFMDFILMSRLDNTPAFPRYSDRKMSEKWQDALNGVCMRSPGTRTAAIISEFLAAIQADGYKLSKNNERRFQKRIKTAFSSKNKAPVKVSMEDSLVGRHGFRLQWVEGARGNASIMRTERGLFIDAKQESGGDFVTLRGEVRVVNPKELVVTGEVVTQVSHIAGGKRCPRQGTFTFKTKGDRKFWRMQEMQNPCDNVLDYVDIFF